ncbi:MAG: hypothetical protein LBQ08_00955 [Holosporaceae bacterium]|nr:hypothetical protein [Holosporaceae bacterium]
MKKIMMAILFALLAFSNTTAKDPEATIRQYDIVGLGKNLRTLLVVDFPTEKPVRLFIMNGWLSTDLKNFNDIFECSKDCGGTKLLSKLMIFAFNPNESVLRYTSPNYLETLGYGFRPPVPIGPRVDIENDIKESFGIDNIIHCLYIADLSDARSCVDFESRVNIREIVSFFPQIKPEAIPPSYDDGSFPVIISWGGNISASEPNSVSEQQPEFSPKKHRGKTSSYWRALMLKSRARHGSGRRQSRLPLPRSASCRNLRPTLQKGY